MITQSFTVFMKLCIDKIVFDFQWSYYRQRLSTTIGIQKSLGWSDMYDQNKVLSPVSCFLLFKFFFVKYGLDLLVNTLPSRMKFIVKWKWEEKYHLLVLSPMTIVSYLQDLGLINSQQLSRYNQSLS